MHIIVASQGYKSTLSAIEVCEAIKKGITTFAPMAKITLVPMADGGEGTLAALLYAKGGACHYELLKGAMGQPVTAPWGVLSDQKTVIIEAAKVCGLSTLKMDELDPLQASTYGLGQLVEIALEQGYRQFLIGLGDTATNDAGVGMAQALGVRFLDRNGQELCLGAEALLDLHQIDLTQLDPRLKESSFTIACDVVNPLLGPKGATQVYAAQKGASGQVIQKLEACLGRFAEIVQKDLNKDLQNLPHAGSAGGVAAACLAFFNADLRSGSELMMNLTDFDKKIEGASLVITGEGRLDAQTLYGKAPFNIARKAKIKSVPVIALVGALGKGYSLLHDEGIGAIIPISFAADAIPEDTERTLQQISEEAVRLFFLR